MKFSAIIPAYNEEKAIRQVINGLRKVLTKLEESYEIIVVDDGSTDQTAKKAQETGAKISRHPENRGYGAAVKTGIKRAQGKYIILIDADGSYETGDLPKLIEALPDCDQVIAARTSEKGTVRMLRKPTKWVLRKIAAYLAGRPIPDLNSGFRIFRRITAKKFLYLLPEGFSASSTLTLAFLCHGHPTKFVPSAYLARIGHSKLNPLKEVPKFFSLLARMVMYFRPLKIFGPLAIATLAIAITKIATDLYRFRWHIATSSVILVLFGLQSLGLGLLADLIVRRSLSETED